MSDQKKKTEMELKRAVFFLQPAHQKNFTFYENGVEQFKHGYPFWKFIEGQYHLRWTPELSTRKQQIIWMNNGFTDDLNAKRLFVVSGAPVVEEKEVEG